MDAILQLRDVSKVYPGPSGADGLTVLNHVSLSISPGEALAIVGPSGSGKSTLLHLMGGLDRPSAGQILLGGTDLYQLRETELAAARNQQIGFVFQSHYLLPQCTVLENVLVPTLATRNRSNASSAGVETRAAHLLKRVGLGERLQHRPGQLSGGERQRVAVVRALINGPRVLLADEPTGALDARTAEELGQLLLELNGEEHLALVLVTHSQALARTMSRTLTLRAGRLES